MIYEWGVFLMDLLFLGILVGHDIMEERSYFYGNK